MPKRCLRGGAAALACVAALVSAGAAQASNAGLRADLNRAAPKINRSEAKILNGLAALQQSHRTKPLIKALGTQDGVLAALRSKIEATPASSARGTTGKADVVAGLGLIISANQTVLAALQKQGVSKAQLKAAAALARKGNVDLVKGARLLKV